MNKPILCLDFDGVLYSYSSGWNWAVKEIVKEIKFPKYKPPAMITIDDRALQFTGEWPELETLTSFRPWNKENV